MDRFIVEPFCQTFALNVSLKSNMDRFIDIDKKQADYNVIIFKIQYG